MSSIPIRCLCRLPGLQVVKLDRNPGNLTSGSYAFTAHYFCQSVLCIPRRHSFLFSPFEGQLKSLKCPVKVPEGQSVLARPTAKTIPAGLWGGWKT